ncbi:MAG TPA: ParB N-terminal domain-containing protein [Burkholderiales bacterium]|nr:ParB N-terminal domain-containing protein [Burkholderiales bacterium]
MARVVGEDSHPAGKIDTLACVAKTARKSGLKRAPARRRPRKAKALSRGIAARECRLEALPREADAVKARVEEDGGFVLGGYADPLGRQPLLLAVLPIDAVEPTPFQRDLSQAHHRKLADVLDRTGMFLDPIIAVTAPEKGFWTPNGRHRLEAMRRLGAKAITALVVPRREVAWQILALNTEKAHNLRERALEVIRIYRGLIDEDAKRAESSFAFYLEEASLVTIGVCYERNPKFAGAAYNPIVRRLVGFSDEVLEKRIKTHERHAGELLDLDERVNEVIQKLKARGFTSPYLRAFVVARINPLRWMQGEPPPLDEVLKTMRERAAKFNTDKVRQEDLAVAGGPPDED